MVSQPYFIKTIECSSHIDEFVCKCDCDRCQR